MMLVCKVEVQTRSRQLWQRTCKKWHSEQQNRASLSISTCLYLDGNLFDIWRWKLRTMSSTMTEEKRMHISWLLWLETSQAPDDEMTLLPSDPATGRFQASLTCSSVMWNRIAISSLLVTILFVTFYYHIRSRTCLVFSSTKILTNN